MDDDRPVASKNGKICISTRLLSGYRQHNDEHHRHDVFDCFDEFELVMLSATLE